MDMEVHNLHNRKFLVAALTIPDFSTTLADITEIWKHKFLFPIAAAG